MLALSSVASLLRDEMGTTLLGNSIPLQRVHLVSILQIPFALKRPPSLARIKSVFSLRTNACDCVVVREAFIGMRATSERTWLEKMHHALKLHGLSPPVRRLVVSVIGGTLLLAGVAMIFLPGPAIVLIPLALAILASEFAWARHLLEKARRLWKRKKTQAKARRS